MCWRVRRPSLIVSVFCGYRRKLQTPSLPVFTQAASAIALLSFAVAWFAHFYVALGATTRDSNVIIPVETVTPPCQRTEATMERGGREVNLVQGVDLLGIGGQQAGRVSGAGGRAEIVQARPRSRVRRSSTTIPAARGARSPGSVAPR